ncbi:MAG: preprotein translocase subunit SecE [Treponemataceae bacterium]|nr:preprotein translocase subunit SecE [Treponema sp.]MDE6245681.1 preprotein translocase subunit SecE [Treponemataceae bacterium]MDE7383309.1 preprotein translocase subunit SecE [Treponemataceae bacterium]
MSKVGQFFRESKAELKKVVWPTREDVFASLKVVIVSTIIVAVILGLLDFGFSKAFQFIMR